MHHPNQLHTEEPSLEVVYPANFGETSSLLLLVEKGGVDVSLISAYAVAKGFTPKDEYHFTIVGARNVVGALQEHSERLSPTERSELRACLDALIPLLGAACLKEGMYHHVVRTYNYGDEPETRESIIQEAEIDGIGTFYEEFSLITGIELGTPFPHLTLFTKGSGEDSAKGISIPSTEAFAAMEQKTIVQ